MYSTPHSQPNPHNLTPQQAAEAAATWIRHCGGSEETAQSRASKSFDDNLGYLNAAAKASPDLYSRWRVVADAQAAVERQAQEARLDESRRMRMQFPAGKFKAANQAVQKHEGRYRWITPVRISRPDLGVPVGMYNAYITMYCGPTRPKSKSLQQSGRNSFTAEDIKRRRGPGQLVVTGWYDTINHRIDLQQGFAAPDLTLTWEDLLQRFFPQFYDHFGEK